MLVGHINKKALNTSNNLTLQLNLMYFEVRCILIVVDHRYNIILLNHSFAEYRLYKVNIRSVS